jgi:hypothetical protein
MKPYGTVLYPLCFRNSLYAFFQLYTIFFKANMLKKLLYIYIIYLSVFSIPGEVLLKPIKPQLGWQYFQQPQHQKCVLHQALKRINLNNTTALTDLCSMAEYSPTVCSLDS